MRPAGGLAFRKIGRLVHDWLREACRYEGGDVLDRRRTSGRGRRPRPRCRRAVRFSRRGSGPRGGRADRAQRRRPAAHARRRSPLDRVALEAPIPRPRRNIFCVGKNYHEHAHEFARSGFDSSAARRRRSRSTRSSSPRCRRRSSPTSATVLIDPAVSTADRLRGRACGDHRQGRARASAAADALDHVWGYTIVNDVTARDLQGRHSQWLIGKSQDTFCPMGPWAVTPGRDRPRRPPASAASSTASCGRTRIRAADLRHPDDHRHALAGHHAARRATSSPPARRPASASASIRRRYLKAGDVVRIEIDGIGVLENRFAEHRAMTTVAVGPIVAEVGGRGPAVVMIHGLGGTVEHVPAAAGGAWQRIGCIRLDLPGSGRSPRPIEPPTLDAMSEAVAEASSGAGRRPGRILSATRWARSSARWLAVNRPELVASLALFGALAEPAEATRTGLPARAKLARRERHGRRSPTRSSRPRSRPIPRENHAGRSRLRARIHHAPGSGMLCPQLRGACQGEARSMRAASRCRRCS